MASYSIAISSRTMIVGAHDLFDEFLAFHPSVSLPEWQEPQKLDLDPSCHQHWRTLSAPYQLG